MARPLPSGPPVQIEVLADAETLAAPAAAIGDLLRTMNLLAAMRGAARPPFGLQCTRADGRAVRGARLAGRRRSCPEVVVVPGWHVRSGPHLNRLARAQRAFGQRLRAAHEAGGHVVGIGNGSALLGEAGLLSGRRAVVPWPFVGSVLRHADAVELDPDSAWCEDERVWTAATPGAVTELALALLSRLGHGELAESARAVLVHARERQALTPALAIPSGARVPPGALERARRWLQAHLAQPYCLARTARAAATSERSLLRHFRAEFGLTPLQYLHSLRVTQARMLLESTYLPVDAIAERCGYRDPAMLRTVFRRATGLTPADYRERFRLREPRRRWGRDLPA